VAPHLSTGGSPEWLRKVINTLKNNFNIYVVEFSNISPKYVIQRNKIIELVGEKNFYSLGNTEAGSKGYYDSKYKILEIINIINPDIIHLNEMPELFTYGGFPESILEILYRKKRPYKIYETSHTSAGEPDSKKVFLPDGFIHPSILHFKHYRNFEIPQYLAEYPIEKREKKDRHLSLKKLNLDPEKIHVLQVGLFSS